VSRLAIGDDGALLLLSGVRMPLGRIFRISFRLFTAISCPPASAATCSTGRGSQLRSDRARCGSVRWTGWSGWQAWPCCCRWVPPGLGRAGPGSFQAIPALIPAVAAAVGSPGLAGCGAKRFGR
jgi:hypothetical protein